MVEAAERHASSSDHGKMRRFVSRLRPRVRHVVWALVIYACFIPYRYESGGEAEVFPVAYSRIYSEFSQLVKQVYFDGGETLDKGTVVAELVNDRQTYDVEKTRKEIDKKQEELKVLLSTPLPEQIAMAKESLKIAEVQLRYSQQQMAVYEGLYRKKAIPLIEYQEEQRQMELLQQSVKSAQANLDYIKKQVNPHEIEATRIEISILQEQLAYYRRLLERTQLKMPIDGKLITMNLKKLKDCYLNTGALFAEVENTSKVRVEIKIPEADSGEVSPGDRVNLKLRAYPYLCFGGKILNVYPAIMEDTFGRYVIGDCIITNKNSEIKSGMTGFAKIEGREMLAVEAFSRALVRFFKIEVWSWIP